MILDLREKKCDDCNGGEAITYSWSHWTAEEVELEVVETLCWDCALKRGICPACGHRGGYSGMCSQCVDEL